MEFSFDLSPSSRGRNILTVIVHDFVECPVLQYPRFRQFQMLCYLDSQTVMLAEHQPI